MPPVAAEQTLQGAAQARLQQTPCEQTAPGQSPSSSHGLVVDNVVEVVVVVGVPSVVDGGTLPVLVVVTPAPTVVVVVGHVSSRRGSHRRMTVSLSFLGRPAVTTVSFTFLVRGRVRRRPSSATSRVPAGPQTASPPCGDGTGSAAPATFAGLRSGCGVQPGTPLRFTQTAISKVQAP